MGRQDAVKLRPVATDTRTLRLDRVPPAQLPSLNAYNLTTNERCSSLGWTIRSATDNFF
jgi:hypothetical protein